IASRATRANARPVNSAKRATACPTWSRSEGHQAAAQGANHRLGAAVGVELVEDAVDVKLHGVLADRQQAGDALVGQAGRQMAEHLLLAGGELPGERRLGI